MSRLSSAVAQGTIVCMLLALLGTQILLSPALVEQGDGATTPYSVMLVLGVLLVSLSLEVVLVCVWRLVVLAGIGRSFRAVTFVWVNAIVIGLFCATIAVVGVSLPLLWVDGVPLAAPLGGGVVALFGLGLTLTAVVFRSLLRQASEAAGTHRIGSAEAARSPL